MSGRAWALLLLAACAREPADRPDAAPDVHEASFEELLLAADMEFSVPEGFERLPGGDAITLPYEAALRHADSGLEVRLSIRPLSSVRVEYEDAHSSTPEAEHLYPLMFQSICDGISRTGTGPGGDLDATGLEPYRADWGGLRRMQPHAEYAPQEHLMLLALHGNGRADAYLVFLYDDPDAAREPLKEALRCLRFRSPAAEE